MCCSSNDIENCFHFVMLCDNYNDLREVLFDSITDMLERQCLFDENDDISHVDFMGLDDYDKYLIVLGKRIGNSVVEKGIDRAFKQFLKDALFRRSDIRLSLNELLNRDDV